MKDVPAPIQVNTGEQESVSKTIDDFFIDTKTHIEKIFGKNGHFEIKSGEISFDGKTVTDNRITYALYNEQPVAFVSETRTMSNKVQYNFFRDVDSLKERL